MIFSTNPVGFGIANPAGAGDDWFSAVGLRDILFTYDRNGREAVAMIHITMWAIKPFDY